MAAAAVLGGAASVFAGGVMASTGPATIPITELQIADRTIGSGIGARQIVRTELYARSGKRAHIGNAVMICTTVSRTEQGCTATYTLPKGAIVVSGVRESQLLFELAIVGGTGLYDNARGTLTTTVIKLKPRRDLLLFRLTG
jgi:hypothetical protein